MASLAPLLFLLGAVLALALALLCRVIDGWWR